MYTKSQKGRKEETFKQEIETDIQNALELISKGFIPVESNTALEHKFGGYTKVSKRVTNYLNSK